jgi:8-oxo-dGTP diphosphatase
MRDDIAPSVFPPARWGYLNVIFEPVTGPLPISEIAAVVVFAWAGKGFVLADIPERGWCTPSGRLEPGETPVQAALRETREEIGADITGLCEIGRYILRDEEGMARYVPAFLGNVEAWGELPANSESLGARRFTRAELPARYWMWDALLAAMFDYAETLAKAELMPEQENRRV